MKEAAGGGGGEKGVKVRVKEVMKEGGKEERKGADLVFSGVEANLRLKFLQILHLKMK